MTCCWSSIVPISLNLCLAVSQFVGFFESCDACVCESYTLLWVRSSVCLSPVMSVSVSPTPCCGSGHQFVWVLWWVRSSVCLSPVMSQVISLFESCVTCSCKSYILLWVRSSVCLSHVILMPVSPTSCCESGHQFLGVRCCLWIPMCDWNTKFAGVLCIYESHVILWVILAVWVLWYLCRLCVLCHAVIYITILFESFTPMSMNPMP